MPAAAAATVLAERFHARPPTLRSQDRLELTSTLAKASVHGGTSYDGLVTLEAAAHHEPLLTLDPRAHEAYPPGRLPGHRPAT